MTASKARQLAAQINKMLGPDAVQIADDQRFSVHYMPTDLLPFDIAFGGGVPRGRFVQIHGDFSTLKSYVGLCAVRATQQRGALAAIIDTENTFDAGWARQVGVNIEELLIRHPETGEEAIDLAELMIRNGVELVVFDSVAAALPQSEHGKRLSKESVQPGRQAALMSLACRKLTSANRHGAAIIWINQLREQIGVSYGNPERAPGGRALGYYASIRLNIRKSGKITVDRKVHDGEKFKTVKHQIGQQYVATVEKSKINQPYRQVFFNWDLRTGMVDEAVFLFAQGVELGLVKQKGTSRWVLGDVTINGREKFIQTLRSDPSLARKLEGLVRQHYGLPGSPEQPRKRAVGTKPQSSARKVAVRTQAAGRAASGTTAARKRSSSKSSTPQRRIR